MKWTKYTIETKNETTDIVASVLFDNGICGAEIDDTLNLSEEDLKTMYVDIPVIKENTGIAKVSFYVAIDNDISSAKNSNIVLNDKVDNSYVQSKDNIYTEAEFKNVFESIKKEFNEYKNMMDMGTLDITTSELDDNVFLNKWKENFKRFNIGDISIVPSWEKKNSDDRKNNIYIEPGSAFGTGKHPTTKLCVDAIRSIIGGKKSLIDIGCGSGILAIVAKKLGISYVKAIDIDRSIKENLIENILLNFESDKVIDIDFGNLLDDKEFYNKIKKDKYDIVVANILAPVIISLICDAHIDEFLNKDGYFICSGIISEMEKSVKDVLFNSGRFSDIKVLREDNWVCMIAKLK